MVAVIIIAVSLLGYLLGSINTSIIVSRMRGSDIRQHGSGNAGLTNMLRTFGGRAAVITLLGDVLKGVLAVVAAKYLSIVLCLVLKIEVPNPVAFSVLLKCASGLGCVLGHNFPVYFRFKGGKGVLTGATVMGMIDWRLMVTALVIFVIVCVLTRYVSLSSIFGSCAVIIMSFVLYFKKLTALDGISVVAFSVIVGGMTVIRHSGNIKRLISGTERKLGEKKKG